MVQATRLLVVAWLSAFSWADAASPFPETVPTVFRVTYAHDLGVEASADLKDGILIYEKKGIQGNETNAIRPTVDEWARFLRGINAAKVYKWSEYYPKTSSTARDGDFRWSIDIQVGDVTLHSDGTTAFPLDGDLTEEQRGSSRNVSYALFMKALSNLIGQNFP